MTTIGGEGSAEVQANPNRNFPELISRPCKEADGRRDIDMSEVQNPYKLPLKTELTVFIEKSDEYASYQYRFENNR